MTENAMLAVEELTVQRGGRAIVRDISVAVYAGSVTAIIGPNGAGKSTLLKAIIGLLPYQGSVLFAGERLSNLSPRERARRVAFVPQHSQLEAPLDVRSMVAQGRYAHCSAVARLSRADSDAVDCAMHLTDVTKLAARPFSQLSYGERRRVLVARALATDAPVILLDEPTASLDVAHALATLDLLKRLAGEGRCLLTALHQFDEVLHVANDVLVLDRGSVVLHGPAHRIIDSRVIPQVFGVTLMRNQGLGFRLAAEASS